MSLGNIGRALTGQAIESAKKNVIDALNPLEPAKQAEKPQTPASAPFAGDNIGAIVLGELQAMQRPLQDDQEMLVHFHSRAEAIRVLQIFVPAPNVLVLAGTDSQGNAARVVTPAATAQLICRVVKVAEGAQPIRVNVLSPRPKQEQQPHA